MLLCALLSMAGAATIGGYYDRSRGTVQELQTAWDQYCETTTGAIYYCDYRNDYKYYDSGFLFDDSNTATPFVDNKKANEYIDMLEDDCGSVDYDEFDDCLLRGCRWSIVYTMCSIVLLSVTIHSLLRMCGACSPHFRCMSMVFAPLLCCGNLAAIIVTGVFRFNTMGKLAAQSLIPTEYDGGEWLLNYQGDIII